MEIDRTTKIKNLRKFTICNEQLKKIAEILLVNPIETPEAVEQLLIESKELRQKLGEVNFWNTEYEHEKNSL